MRFCRVESIFNQPSVNCKVNQIRVRRLDRNKRTKHGHYINQDHVCVSDPTQTFCVGKQFTETRVQPSANGSKAPWSLADMRQWPAHITKGYKAGKGIIRPLPDLMKESV